MLLKSAVSRYYFGYYKMQYLVNLFSSPYACMEERSIDILEEGMRKKEVGRGNV